MVLNLATYNFEETGFRIDVVNSLEGITANLSLTIQRRFKTFMTVFVTPHSNIAYIYHSEVLKEHTTPRS